MIFLLIAFCIALVGTSPPGRGVVMASMSMSMASMSMSMTMNGEKVGSDEVPERRVAVLPWRVGGYA